jgi:uncharacterized protein (DUF1697 family)
MSPRRTAVATRRHAAFLRGVMPYNCKMPELRAAFEAAGFGDVRTVLASGNVVFDDHSGAVAEELAQRAEAAMAKRLGRVFPAIVRSLDELRALLATDPYGNDVPAEAKRVVTFLRRAPAAPVPLPDAQDGARIVALRGREAFTVYVRGASGPTFMEVIERTFGKDVTTRTWDTLLKVAR